VITVTGISFTAIEAVGLMVVELSRAIVSCAGGTT
jgi:hypothetical protein